MGLKSHDVAFINTRWPRLKPLKGFESPCVPIFTMGKKEVLQAISTLAGAVIGAGVLGIPYVVSQAGLLTGIFDLLLIGALVLIIYMLYGEVTLRTKGIHQLTGYAEKYLGKIGKTIASVSMIIGAYGALIAYIIGIGISKQAIFGGSSLGFSIGFFVIGSLIVYSGIKGLEKSEVILTTLIIICVVLICGFGISKVDPANLKSFDLTKLLVPYGVILFAYMGTSAIPEMREELIKNKKSLKKSIFMGMLIPVIVYIAFTIIVVGIVGTSGFNSLDSNQRIATIAIGQYVGKHMFIFGNLFALCGMIASFIVSAVALMEMFEYDLKKTKNQAFLFTLIIPFIISVTNLTSFIQVIGISGVIIGGINGTLIVLMHKKAQTKGDRKPEYSIKAGLLLRTVVIILFMVGIIHKLFSLFLN